MMTAELYLFCPVCGQDRPAEQPQNGFGGDVHEDERVCVDCCAALFVDPAVLPACTGSAA